MSPEARAGFVAFDYPDYPRDLVDQFVEDSAEALQRMGIRIGTINRVTTFRDVDRVVHSLRAEEDFDLIIAVLISWVEAPNVISTLRGLMNYPILLWSHTMYQDKDSGWLTIGPLPAAGILRQTLEEMGATFKFVWGMPGEKALESQIVPFARAAHCARRLSISRVGLLGYASMGMYTGTIDHIRLRHDIGPEIDHLDQYAIVKKVEEIRDDQISSLVEKAKAEWQLSEGVSDSALGQTMRFYLALKSLAEEREWNALTVKCQYELSRLYGFAPCVALSMLADEMTSSCEGDLPLLITQLIMHYLSGQPVSYGDVHLITEDSILLGACGFAPLKLGAGRPLIGHHTALYEGLLNQTNYREGKVTLARLASSKDGHFRMHIARGEGKTPRPYHEVGCPPYPSIEVKLDGSTKHFGQNLMSQHYSIGFKDLVEELKELCLILKIEPVLS